MIGVRLWLRRTWIGWPLLCGAIALVMLRSIHWVDWWQWMISTVNGSVMLLSPLAGALACNRVIRGWSKETRQGFPCPYAFRGLMHIGIATLVQAWTAMALGVIAGAAICLRAGAQTGFMEWPGQAVVGVVALIPAVGMGLIAGCFSESLLSVASIFVGIFLSHLLLWDVSGPQFLSPDLPTTPMWGYKLAALRLYWEIAGNIGLALVSVGVLYLFCDRARTKRVRVMFVISGGLTLAVLAWVAIARNPAYYVLMVRLP